MKIDIQHPNAIKAWVTLNGEIVKNAVEADEERGYVDILEYQTGFIEPVKHRLFGRVRIGFNL